MAATAIIIHIENQKYYYNDGVFYEPENKGYKVVEAPVGATVEELPQKTETVTVTETTNNYYYYGGTFYEKSDGGYTVVPPTAGTLVPHLPEGAEEVRVGDVTYVKLGEVYYQPVKVDGKDMYEVVDVEEDKEENKE